MKKVFICGKIEKNTNYINACLKAGALVYCGTDYSVATECDAMLLPGGADINPQLYNSPNLGSINIDNERDEWEYKAIKYFVDAKKPIFGICRGLQILNVYFGGTLNQDIPNHKKIGPDTDQTHHVHTENKVFIELYGKDFIVNSAHHQVVKDLSKDFTAVMFSDEGYVEAMKHNLLPIYAVQWHPERVTTVDGIKILSWFINTI